jgi:FkbM family methyltransferase
MDDRSGIVTEIAQWIHSGLTRSLSEDSNFTGAARRRFFGALRRRMLRWHDPVVRHELPDRRSVLLHLSHNYPYYKAAHPYYDTSLGRLASFIEAQKGTLAMVDVGANVGDTLWQLPAESRGRFLCIEADDKYFPLLELNTRGQDSVLSVKAICDERDRESNVTLVQKAGTSYISESGGSVKQHHQTLDQIVTSTDFRPNLVKIDTDGYDYKVLRGARDLLRNQRPVLFFELSPKHLVKAGEDPVSIFGVLDELGYKYVFFYDSYGFPVVRVAASAKEQLSQLLAYAATKYEFYFDALLFHSSDSGLFDSFIEAEMNYFAMNAVTSSWSR